MPLPRYLFLLASVIAAAGLTIWLAGLTGGLGGPALPAIALVVAGAAIAVRFVRR